MNCMSKPGTISFMYDLQPHITAHLKPKHDNSWKQMWRRWSLPISCFLSPSACWLQAWKLRKSMSQIFRQVLERIEAMPSEVNPGLWSHTNLKQYWTQQQVVIIPAESVFASLGSLGWVHIWYDTWVWGYFRSPQAVSPVNLPGIVSIL